MKPAIQRVQDFLDVLKKVNPDLYADEQGILCITGAATPLCVGDLRELVAQQPQPSTAAFEAGPSQEGLGQGDAAVAAASPLCGDKVCDGEFACALPKGHSGEHYGFRVKRPDPDSDEHYIGRCRCGGKVVGTYSFGHLFTYCSKCTPVVAGRIPSMVGSSTTTCDPLIGSEVKRIANLIEEYLPAEMTAEGAAFHLALTRGEWRSILCGLRGAAAPIVLGLDMASGKDYAVCTCTCGKSNINGPIECARALCPLGKGG